jgi:hypothetical protein
MNLLRDLWAAGPRGLTMPSSRLYGGGALVWWDLIQARLVHLHHPSNSTVRVVHRGCL